MTPVVDVVRTYLSLSEPAQLRPAPVTDPAVVIRACRDLSPARFREMYRAVGWRWLWRDRLAWSDERLAAHLESPNVLVWECLAGDATAGFFELNRCDDGSVEIAYFGLVAAFMGRGIGKALLTRAAEEAWALGASRVWLHTCTLDSPRALPNYLARGFRVDRTETYSETVPDAAL